MWFLFSFKRFRFKEGRILVEGWTSDSLSMHCAASVLGREGRRLEGWSRSASVRFRGAATAGSHLICMPSCQCLARVLMLFGSQSHFKLLPHPMLLDRSFVFWVHQGPLIALATCRPHLGPYATLHLDRRIKQLQHALRLD